MIYKATVSLFLFIVSTNFIIWYEALALALTLYFLLDLFNAIGKKIPFLEVITLLACVTWIAMPVVFYEIFNEYNDLSALWVTFMPTPAHEYFSFALPATLLFALGLSMPLMNGIWKTTYYKIRLKNYLSDKSYIGAYLIFIGIVASLLARITPEIIRNIVQNFALLTYVGMFYIIYSPFKHKLRAVLICISLTIAHSIASGMYGQLVFMSIISSMILLAGKEIKWGSKLIVMASGLFLIFLIQSIKFEYRESTWEGFNRKADPALFGKLIWSRITNPIEIFRPERVFNLAVRANQGKIIARAMDYVPKFEPFACGQTIMDAVAASFIPRFLWPSKPKSGGATMVCKYLGDCDSALRGISYNVGPIGEAYINFGKVGGSIFMFFYGLLFNFLFKQALLISRYIPSLILWFPLIFLSFFTMENDILSFLNSFVKSAFFAFIIFKIAKTFFKIKL